MSLQLLLLRIFVYYILKISVNLEIYYKWYTFEYRNSMIICAASNSENIKDERILDKSFGRLSTYSTLLSV